MVSRIVFEVLVFKNCELNNNNNITQNLFNTSDKVTLRKVQKILPYALRSENMY